MVTADHRPQATVCGVYQAPPYPFSLLLGQGDIIRRVLHVVRLLSGEDDESGSRSKELSSAADIKSRSCVELLRGWVAG